MEELTIYASPETILADKTLVFVKKQLSGIEFAVTGSYANDVLNGLDTFGKKSDLDIVVEEQYAEMAANMLLTMQDYKTIEKVHNYGGRSGDEDEDSLSKPKEDAEELDLDYVQNPGSKFNSIEKVHNYGGRSGDEEDLKPKEEEEEQSKPGPLYTKDFSEYMLNGDLTAVHIIGSYTNKQKDESNIINGIKYIQPILPKNLVSIL